MEPKEQKKQKTPEATPEQQLITASLARLKVSGLAQVRSMATWADISLTKSQSGNTTQLVKLPPTERDSRQSSPVRIVLDGDSPDNMHFTLRVDASGFLLKSEQEIDATLLPYFYLISSFEKAVSAENLEIITSDITYADSYLAVYNKAFEMQLQYKEWANKEAQKTNHTPPFSHLEAQHKNLPQHVQQLIFGKFPKDIPQLNFGIREYLLMINGELPKIYNNLKAHNVPLLLGRDLVDNTPAQQDFLAELSMLLLHYRPYDETFEQAIIALVSNDTLQAFHHPINLPALSEIIDNSTHPLRSFIFVRAMLYQKAVMYALALYHSINLPGIKTLRDFRQENVGPIDLGMFGAIVTGELLLDQLDQGRVDFGFSENDRRKA